MKGICINKIFAIGEVKTKAFFGKNCIIMPAFAVGYTLLFRFVYSYIRSDGGYSSELSAYVLSLGLVMNIGMTGIYCTSLLLAEEKEKRTLRVLMTSSVNSLEFFLGSVLPVLFFTAVINFFLIPISGYHIKEEKLLVFAGVTILASLISCIIGMLLGIFAKDQVSTSTIVTPALMILIFIPTFSSVVEILEKISGFLFTGVVMDMVMKMAESSGNGLSVGSLGVMGLEAVLALLLFVIFYRMNGYERD